MSEPALLAASQAAEATAALLLFATEGPDAFGNAFGDVEVVEKLAEALARTIDIEIDGRVALADPDYRAALGQLQAACTRFIAGWAG